MRRKTDNLKRIMAALVSSLFKVAFNLRHLVGNVGEADHIFSFHLCEGIERSGFHFNTENTLYPSILNRCFGFAEGGIRRPRHPTQYPNRCAFKNVFNAGEQC